MTYKGKTITKHIKGSWYVRVQFNNKVVCLYGKTQLHVYEKLKIVADEIDRQRLAQIIGSFEPRAAETSKADETSNSTIVVGAKSKPEYSLGQWFLEWMESYKVGHVRASTLDGFKSKFRMLGSLHNFKLTEITNMMLSKALNEITAIRSKDGAHNLLKQMFGTAFNNRLIETNPTLNLPRPKQSVVRQQKAFTAEQEKKFIDLCLADLPNYEPYLVCLLQGIRKGEMLALRPDDFDFLNSTLRIDESFDPDHPNDLLTKNDASNRIMPMFALTKQVLLKYRDADPDKFIYKFCQKTFYSRFRNLLERNGLPIMTIHQLRHTFISRCHEKRIDEIVVQRWVGHAIGSRMTRAVYTHISNDAEQKYIELLNQN